MGMAGRWAREWFRGERQRRLPIGRTRFGQVQNLGHQRWCPYLKKKLFLGGGGSPEWEL
jgi:hypothetical protein